MGPLPMLGDAQVQRDSGRPAWMRTLADSARTWLGLLPDSLATLRRTVDNIKDPLYRFFEREVNSGARLLLDVRQDLNDVLLICKVCHRLPSARAMDLIEMVAQRQTLVLNCCKIPLQLG